MATNRYIQDLVDQVIAEIHPSQTEEQIKERYRNPVPLNFRRTQGVQNQQRVEINALTKAEAKILKDLFAAENATRRANNQPTLNGSQDELDFARRLFPHIRNVAQEGLEGLLRYAQTGGARRRKLDESTLKKLLGTGRTDVYLGGSRQNFTTDYGEEAWKRFYDAGPYAYEAPLRNHIGKFVDDQATETQRTLQGFKYSPSDFVKQAGKRKARRRR